MPYNAEGMNPQMLLLISDFQKAYPNVRLTSGYRDPARNAAVGGASGSQHLHGNAMDFSLAGMSPTQQMDALNWWKNQGASGFGYYPGSESAHVDTRQGPQRFWGPDYTKGSLNQTPEWFQSFAGGAPGGNSLPTFARGQAPGDFSLEALQASQSQPTDAPPAAARSPSASALGATGMSLMTQGQGGKAMIDPSVYGPAPAENRPQMQALPKRRVLPTPGPQYAPLPVNRFVGGLLDG